MKLSGRIWALTDREGHLIQDIDTDMIFHNQYLAETDINKMGQYALDNLEGWENFAQLAQPGDMIVAGANFGAGSSRQQAVDCFKILGITLIIAPSFGAIYKRNAINSALPIMEVPGVEDVVLKSGETARVDTATGTITSGEISITGRPFSAVQREILEAGGLFEFGRLQKNR